MLNEFAYQFLRSLKSHETPRQASHEHFTAFNLENFFKNSREMELPTPSASSLFACMRVKRIPLQHCVVNSSFSVGPLCKWIALFYLCISFFVLKNSIRLVLCLVVYSLCITLSLTGTYRRNWNFSTRITREHALTVRFSYGLPSTKRGSISIYYDSTKK